LGTMFEESNGEMTDSIKQNQDMEEVELLDTEETSDGIPAVEVIEPEDEEATLDTDEILQELQEVRHQRDEYLDGWQRAQAEFANYKKRVERDRQQVQQNSIANVVRRYLEILDDLERALANQPQDKEGADWADGIDLVYKKWLKALESDDIKPMQAEGEIFDPSFHEAISQEANDDYESGEIIEVIQNGYMIGDRVLRPARVRVAQ
jgi:molecular chaperone GrpE